MASLHELRSTRLLKLQKLEEHGFSGYPTTVPHTHTLREVKEGYERLCVDIENTRETISFIGRVMAIRGQGAIQFVVLKDENMIFQSVFKKDDIEETMFSLFGETVDLGDFISVSGILFETQKGERSLLVKSWAMATKSLLPLPDKWAGLEDADESARKRYLEIATDTEVYTRFKIRSQIISRIRRFFDEKGFLEIETPVLQSQAGGAMARTFDTYHNDYAMPMVLRIALELEHKMLMVGGFPAVYEIGKNFRNEGSDPTHIQEFTMIEWYAAYRTLEENIAWTQELVQSIATDVMGGKMEYKVHDKKGEEHTVSLLGAWPRLRFDDLLREKAQIDIALARKEEIDAKAKSYGMSQDEIQKTGRGNILDFIFKKSVRHTLIQPTFVTHYPGDLKPLAQQNTDGTAAVAQLVIAGAEVTNQYAELVNPLVQRSLLESQSSARDGGDEEAMQVDERFLTAMEHGMPPMTGFGMGIDRIVAFFTEQKNLRDTLFFPIMRPEEEVRK